MSFFTRRGAPENWGDQVLCLRSNVGIKRFFQIKKGGSPISFKEIKSFITTLSGGFLVINWLAREQLMLRDVCCSFFC